LTVWTPGRLRLHFVPLSLPGVPLSLPGVPLRACELIGFLTADPHLWRWADMKYPPQMGGPGISGNSFTSSQPAWLVDFFEN